jgi:homoserine dehydrogenase
MSSRPCRVALLGFGTVGSAVARRLTGAHRVPGVVLTHVFSRFAKGFSDFSRFSGSPRFPGGSGFAEVNLVNRLFFTSRIDDILTSDADVVVEAIGGVDPAAEWIRRALAAGKSVVTCNKQVIAHCGPELLTLASRQGRQLRFEGAVGGAMPIVGAVSGGLAGDRLRRIVAILNGTTNFVLSRIEALGCSVKEALAEARVRGFAEADAAADLDGIDARAKLSILCALGFGLRVEPSAIETRSVEGLTARDLVDARRRGGAMRQVAHAAYDEPRGALTAWVAPVFVPRESLFARTTGIENAAIVSGEYAGDVQLIGAGAGGDVTAVAIISDLVAIARDRSAIVPAPALSRPKTIHGISHASIASAFASASYHGEPSISPVVRADTLEAGYAGAL